jgi:hypothetical protein
VSVVRTGAVSDVCGLVAGGGRGLAAPDNADSR